MIDSAGQIGVEAFAFPAQTRRTGASYADPNTPDGAVAPSPVDRYISSVEQTAYGIYSRESLMASGAMPGETVAALDEDGLDSRIVEPDDEKRKSPGAVNELDAADKNLVERLAARDLEVRKHESAHAAAAGEYVMGPPSYTFQRGPDGKMYAIGGSLAVDVGKEATPAENRRKSMVLQGAARGVSEASMADAMVAAEASRLMGEGIQIQA